VIVIVVVFITIVVMMVVVVLSGMFAMPLATALIMPMHPVVMVFPPRPGYPHPFVATVPIARTIGVIRPITHVDREPVAMALGRISMQTDRRATVRAANFIFIVYKWFV
jgi:hypothetical protein